MINKLKEIEFEELYDMLCDTSRWKTLDIDYHPPRVERLWTQYDDEYRLLLHKIHPCSKEDALIHPHPWKSAVHVLPMGGQYGHRIGTVKYDVEVYCDMIVNGEMYYEMLHIDGVHSVQPIDAPVYSVMLIGKPIWKDINTDEFNETLDNKPENLSELSNEDKLDLLNIFKKYFELTLSF